MLGRGHFGRVMLATHRESGLVLAVKEMREEKAGAVRRGARGVGEDGGNQHLHKQVGERSHDSSRRLCGSSSSV